MSRRLYFIGEARNALERAGWRATIAANRVTVNEEVLAQLIPATVRSFGAVDAYWVILRSPARDPFGSSARKGPEFMTRRQVVALMFRGSRGSRDHITSRVCHPSIHPARR